MEENSNLTAERSLEIITEQIERSRQAVSKTTGESLYVSGLCTAGMAVVVAVVNMITMNTFGAAGLGHLLWLVLPVVIWLASRRFNKERAKAPVSLVGSMVAKTWTTFAVFVLGFFVIAIIWGFLGARLMPPSEFKIIHIRVAPVIVLLMGMAVTITGHILHQRWLVRFGIIAGLLCFVWEHFYMGEWLLLHLLPLTPHESAAYIASMPCLTIFVFALVGLLLPGMMLKKQCR